MNNKNTIEVSNDELTTKWLKMKKSAKDRPYGCIYLITNKVNQKVYVGKSVKPSSRIEKYNRLACEDQPRLFNALKKWGLGNFYFEVIDEVADNIQLDFLEIVFIDKNNSRDYKRGYNIQGGGGGGLHSEESKRKIGEANKRRVWKDESKRKASESKKGHKYRVGIKTSDEAKANISNAMKNSEKAKESLKKVQESNNGLKWTSEQKEKLSLTLVGNQRSLGYKHTEETKAKMSASHQNMTEEQRKGISLFQKGRKRSTETKARMAEASRKRWRDKKALEQQL